MASRYTNYQAFIDDITQEAGDSEGQYDSLVLNLCQSAVDFLNTLKGRFREASGSITVNANDYDYTISSSLSDFSELIDRKTSLRLSDGTFIPLAKTRLAFLSGWKPSSDTGAPSVARIFAGVLYLRPTPSASDTLTVEYYKRLAQPALTGEVLIPDEFISLVRAEILKRLEAYFESDSAVQKQTIYGEMKSGIIKAINRDYCQNVLPQEVVDEDDDL